MVLLTLALGPMTAKDLIAVGDRGKDPALFLSKTIPCLAASRASSWFAGVQTSFGPSFPYNWVLGLPSKNPNLINVAKLLETALSTATSVRSPLFTAASVC